MKNFKGMGLFVLLLLCLAMCGGIVFAIGPTRTQTQVPTTSATQSARSKPTSSPHTTQQPSQNPGITITYHSTSVGKLFLSYHDSYVVVKFSGISGRQNFSLGFENGIASTSFNENVQGGHYSVTVVVYQDKSPPQITVLWCGDNDLFCQS